MGLLQRILCVFVVILAAFAQGNRGTITGAVTDSTEAVVAGATVKVRDNDIAPLFRPAAPTWLRGFNRCLE